jgi:hypothetical protein
MSLREAKNEILCRYFHKPTAAREKCLHIYYKAQNFPSNVNFSTGQIGKNVFHV